MSKKISLVAGIFGNALEWYDFTIYAFFAPILANLFFPSKSLFLSLIATFGVFAAGFLIRPVGALFFGYIGDHWGRKKALILSMIVMSFPTFLLALLPTYKTIGIAAPILLTLLRLIQGTAISGELSTAIAYLIEHSPSNKRGFAGSLAMSSAFIGISLGATVAAIFTNFFEPTQIASWGWRLSFALGGMVGIVGLIFRLYCTESKIYEEMKQQLKQKKVSVLHHFANLDWKAVFIAIFLTATMSVGDYFLIAYFNTFLIKELGWPAKPVMLINFISLILFTMLLPIAGILSDKFGRKLVLGSGTFAVIVISFPVFWLLNQKTMTSLFIAEILFSLALAPVCGLIPTTLAELFETKSRNSGLSIGYNVSVALFGGTAPIVALTLVQFTHNFYSPAWYVIACAIVSLITLIWVKESYRTELS